jgi:hypothetical protein
MSAAHLHLLTTHVPVLGTLFGLLLLVCGLCRRSGELQKVSLAVFVIAATLTIPAYLSGSPTEDMLKGLPGVTEDVVEQHEELAAVAFTAEAALGVAALAGLIFFRRRRPVARWFALSCVVLGLIAGALLGWTAHLGGKVRHTEIRGQPPASYLR